MNALTQTFTLGGPCGDSNYVERESDQQVLTHLIRHEYVMITEPRQQGKTSLLMRLRERLRQDWVFAYVNCLRLPVEDESAWYASLYNTIVSYLKELAGIHSTLVPRNASEWSSFLESICGLAKNEDLNVVVAFDEVGAAAKVPWSGAFFGQIRVLYDERYLRDDLRRIVFAFAGMVHPSSMILDPVTSPFNIVHSVRIPDFTYDQTKHLVLLLKLPDEVADGVADRIQYWTAGQPYMTQSLCHALLAHHAMGDLSEVTGVVDMEVERFISRDVGHLEHVLRPVLGEQGQSTLRFLTELRRGAKKVRYDMLSDHPHIGPMALSGLVKGGESDYCEIRNRIYERAIEIKGFV